VEVQGSPEHQEEQSGRKRGKARACIRTHGRAPKTHAAQPTRKMGQPDRAPRHGLVVLGLGDAT